MSRISLIAAIGVMMLGVCPASAEQAAARIDPHLVYEQKCRGCHFEHGADLSRQNFALSDDTLRVSRTGVAVPKLLGKHHGVQLTQAEMDGLIGLFKSGIKWAGVYQHRCASCHDKAAAFARSKLGIADGRVTSKSSSADVANFLTSHGEATPAEIETLMEMFKYQLETEAK